MKMSGEGFTHRNIERSAWAFYRSCLEKKLIKTTSRGKKVWCGIKPIDLALPILKMMLHLLGLYQRGVKNAHHVGVTNIEVTNNALPVEFDGYRILFFSDLHLDGLPGIEYCISRQIADLEYDLCLIGGDFRKKSSGPFEQIANTLNHILDSIVAQDGVFGVLGNHDTHNMVPFLESLGIAMLINESVEISRGDASIIVTGIDDPHFYFTTYSEKALQNHPDKFKVLLAHTPEVSQLAVLQDYGLYLCGHTHGGQICLPNSKPVITHLHHEKEKAVGLWKSEEMIGYTSRGVGISGLPVRFNCNPEVVLITLRKI